MSSGERKGLFTRPLIIQFDRIDRPISILSSLLLLRRFTANHPQKTLSLHAVQFVAPSKGCEFWWQGRHAGRRNAFALERLCESFVAIVCIVVQCHQDNMTYTPLSSDYFAITPVVAYVFVFEDVIIVNSHQISRLIAIIRILGQIYPRMRKHFTTSYAGHVNKKSFLEVW